METVYTYPSWLAESNDVRSMLDSNSHPFPRSGHRLVADDEGLYLIGGYNPSLAEIPITSDRDTNYPLPKELWKFHIKTKTWARLCRKADAIPDESASHTVVVGGSGIPFGKCSSNKVHFLKLGEFQWQEMDIEGNTMPEAQYGHAMAIHRRHCGQFKQALFLYVVGGTTGLEYNINIYELRLDLPFHRSDHSAPMWNELFISSSNEGVERRYLHEVVVYGDKIHVFGGGTATSVLPLDKIDAFDIETKQWTKYDTTACCSTHGFPTPRLGHRAVLHKQYFFVVGGRETAISSTLNEIWRFDLENSKWLKLPLSVSDGLYFYDVAILDGMCYIYAGIVTSDTLMRTSSLYRFQLSSYDQAHLTCGAESMPEQAMSVVRRSSCRMNNDDKTKITENMEVIIDALEVHPDAIMAHLIVKGIFSKPMREIVDREAGDKAKALKIVEILTKIDHGKTGLHEALKEACALSLYTDIFGD